MKYQLVSDDSGHDYVIPSDKSDDWYDFDFEDDNFRLPPWAVRIEGGLEFENPTEDGQPIFFNSVKCIPGQLIHDGLLGK